ncbi:hypothetical protein E308F_29710 [Moorella sp. E308F]|uniref:hypothetical protein n=1 Tax=Moorella sp. E308F TaxID=2572682 RepID=UPI0010FFB39E|nr:hypothetical protein [Moorella sp. E308F]GEA16725.1 hypothetical protein E308F_29710 [Moorella sp. E308F]
MKKPVDFTGSVISGTLRSEDLIPRFLDLLEHYWPEQANNLLRLYNLPKDWDLEIIKDFIEERPEDVDWLLETLFDALDEIAPKGCYFGSHPGDGSDFGFWECEEF